MQLWIEKLEPLLCPLCVDPLDLSHRIAIGFYKLVEVNFVLTSIQTQSMKKDDTNANNTS